MEYVSEERLYACYQEHPNVQIDSRKVTSGDLFFGLAGTQVHGNEYAAKALTLGAAYVVVDDPRVLPDGDDRYLLVEDTLEALQRLATHHRRRLRMPVLAITGSNGKTTTKELVRDVMARQYSVHATRGNFNNHIGLPLTILATPPGTEMMILEMGANHQGEIAELCLIGQPTHGLVTNVGEAHLEGFGGFEGVIAGKGELFDYLATRRGVAFVNRDEKHLSRMADGVGRVIYFEESAHPNPEVAPLEIKVTRTAPVVTIAFLNGAGELLTAVTHLGGRHNLQNIKAAIAVGKYFKVPSGGIVAALEAYRATNHRSQVMERAGVNFYFDAYNANPSSVRAALMGFAADRTPPESAVVLGEMLELGERSAEAHRRIALLAGQLAKTVVLVGEGHRQAARELEYLWFADTEELAGWFWQQDWTGRTVFVKGSRGNKLEGLLERAPVRQEGR